MNADLANQDSHGDGECNQAGQETGVTPSPSDPWRLNPQRMPRSITLELPEPLLAELLALADSQDRCLDEIVLDLIEAQLNRPPGAEASSL
jgi:hypothetical protein